MFEKSQNLYREKPFQGQKNNSVDYCAADLFIGMTTEGPGFCFCLVVFHVSDGVGVNLLLWPILHSERSIIVIQEVCSSLLGWGHYKAPPCISSQEASISFNWIDKWKDEWDSTSPLHCWVVLSFCAQVCLFRFLALILRKQTSFPSFLPAFMLGEVEVTLLEEPVIFVFTARWCHLGCFLHVFKRKQNLVVFIKVRYS